MRNAIGALVALFVSVPAVARADENWFTDRASGCRVFDSYVLPGGTVQWKGACKAGQAEGPGVLVITYAIAPSGSAPVRKEGSWTNGHQNGRALIHLQGGARFEGEAKDGVPTGHGFIVWPGVGRYDGEFQNGAAQGYGSVVYEDGTPPPLGGGKYVGDFVNWKRQGKGIFTSRNGDTYEGEWGNNDPNGKGTLTTDHGKNRYSGTWASGCALDARGALHAWPVGEDCEVMRDYLTRYSR